MPFQPTYDVPSERRPYQLPSALPQPPGRRIGVLFLHGFMGSPLSSRPLAEHLTAHGLTARCPLLPGHGHFPDKLATAGRKQWLADHLQLNGKLVLDAGAVKALGEGKSLLPIGVVEVSGEFERGAAVACMSPEGLAVARGLVNYGSSDARRIARRASTEIESILGYLDEPEMIHRDNLVTC